MEEMTVQVPTISCGHCVKTIERELADLDGVISVKADAEAKSVTVSLEAPATPAAVRAALADIGYPPGG